MLKTFGPERKFAFELAAGAGAGASAAKRGIFKREGGEGLSGGEKGEVHLDGATVYWCDPSKPLEVNPDKDKVKTSKKKQPSIAKPWRGMAWGPLPPKIYHNFQS